MSYSPVPFSKLEIYRSYQTLNSKLNTDEPFKLHKLISSVFLFFLWLTDITAAGILGYLAAITLRAAAAEHDADLAHMLLV